MLGALALSRSLRNVLTCFLLHYDPYCVIKYTFWQYSRRKQRLKHGNSVKRGPVQSDKGHELELQLLWSVFPNYKGGNRQRRSAGLLSLANRIFPFSGHVLPLLLLYKEGTEAGRNKSFLPDQWGALKIYRCHDFKNNKLMKCLI